MATATIRQLWGRYRSTGMLMKLIIVNIAVFILLRVAGIISVFTLDNSFVAKVLDMVEMPSRPSLLMERPWTVVTYMFAQYDVFHILFNMLWLYWFGSIFVSFSTRRRLFALYLYGGLAGAAFFMGAYNLLPVFTGVDGSLIGSSASVIAIVAATAIIAPDYKVGLLFLGTVSLKWIALITIGIDLIGITSANAGGHLAHIGGAVIGAAYALALSRGVDITAPFNAIADKTVDLFRKIRFRPRRRTSGPQPGPSRGFTTSATGRARTATPRDQADLDIILDKIKKSGYTSLTPDERRRLFDVSDGIKDQ